MKINNKESLNDLQNMNQNNNDQEINIPDNIIVTSRFCNQLWSQLKRKLFLYIEIQRYLFWNIFHV